MSKTNVGAMLNGIAIFAQLNAQQLSEIAKECAINRYLANETILSRNQEDNNVYFVCSGTVRVTSFSVQGREASFNEKSAGDYFGELAAIDGGSRGADVLALSDVSLLSVSCEAFMKILAAYPAVNQHVLKDLACNVRLLTERVFEFTVMDVRTRIMSELLRLAVESDAAEESLENNAIILDPLPKHYELASRVSTTREAVSRVLKQLQLEGLIEKQGTQKLLVKDLRLLQSLVLAGS